MLYLAFAIELALMIGAPVALGYWLVHRFGTPPSLLLWGAATFIAAQAVRQPLLFALTWLFKNGILPAPPQSYAVAFNVALLSLTAGLFEEGARYLGYRLVVPGARRWRDGVAYGAAHGGCEAIILGLLVMQTFLFMALLRQFGDTLLLRMPAQEQVHVLVAMKAFWAAPWHVPLLGGIERIVAIGLHMTLAVMVLQAVVQGRRRWLLGAIALHATANAVAVTVLSYAGAVVAEVALALFVAPCLWLMWHLRDDDERTVPAAAASAAAVSDKPGDVP